MTDEKYLLTHDSAVPMFDADLDADGITVDDEDETVSFDWNEVPVVEVDEPPHARAFDTNKFYKIEGATVARPIQQPYAVGDDVEIYVKPADELRDAAWSLDNKPFVLGHPDTGMVKDVRDVHGFWKKPRYDDDEDRLKEDLYIPHGDEDAKEFVEENHDVSLGFYNLLFGEYDGDIGSLVDPEEDHVDGYQVNMYVDHVAGVGRGRCASAHGCGLDDAHSHGTVVMRTADRPQDDNHGMKETTDQPSGIKTEDGTWFAVGPGEHNKDSTPHPGDHMFPVDSCSDIEDAWGLRNNAKGLSISTDTLEARIKRAADAKDCPNPDPDESEDSLEVILDRYDPGCEIGDSNMSEQEETTDDGGFDLPDLSIDALAEKHDDVRELREAKDELESDLDSIREGLGLDEDECPCDLDLDSYSDAKETVEAIRELFAAEDDELDEDVDLVEFAEDMHEEWQEARDERREELLDDLEELKADRDEWEDESINALEDELERRKEIAKEFDASALDETQDEDPAETESFEGRRSLPRGKYA